MAELTVYTSEADGDLLRGNIGETYQEVRCASEADGVRDEGEYARIGQQKLGVVFYIARGGLFFDASALPDNAVIGSVVLSVYVQGLTEDNAFVLHVVSGRELTNPMVVSNYGGLFGARTSFGELASGSMVADQYNDITLNALGRAEVLVSGETKFGLRTDRDINGNAPSAAEDEYVLIRCEEEGSSEEAKLVITYTSATPSVNTDAASSITTTGATMNGTLVNDGGAACDCQFEWGRTTAYGNTTTAQSKTTGQTFLQALTGLLPNTLYHFRAITNGATGADKTFMTLAPVAGAAPTIVSGLVGALRFYFGSGTYITEIGLGGYGRAFSTIPWGHYGAGDPEGHPDLTPAPEYDVCAMAADAWNRYLIHESLPPTPGDPEARQQWEREKAHLRDAYYALHAACSLARRQAGGATGVNK